MKVLNNFLYDDNGNQVSYIATPNKDGIYVPQYIVMHYTADTSAASTISWFQDPASQVSAHLLIGRDGTITQFVPFNNVAWHAGDSTWDGLVCMNHYSIGIELVNAGRLGQSNNNWICLDNSQIIPPDEILVARHKDETFVSHWQIYPQVQISTAIEAGKALISAYTIKNILGHDDVAPGRKFDPGPAFPMDSFRTAILGDSN